MAWAGISLLACFLLLSRASAEPATSSVSTAATAPVDDLPAGYATQIDGPVRWTYPLAADDEVRTLRASQAQVWRRIVAELGVSISPELDIRVATNPEQMRRLVPPNTQQLPGYASGGAVPPAGVVLLTLTEPESFMRADLSTTLAHELSHIALHRAVNGVNVPRWFSEGVAVQQSEESSFARIRSLWEGTLRGNLVPFDALAVAFPANHADADLAYAESADFVGFMLAGSDERGRFRALLRELASGQVFGEAVQRAYHVDLGYMEREWRATLTQRFGRWPMLFMGLTSLWVLGAVLLVVGYARARARHRSTLRRWAIEEAPVLTAPNQPNAQPAAGNSPAGAIQSSLDDFFDNRLTKHDPGVPTVVHDGQSYTLH